MSDSRSRAKITLIGNEGFLVAVGETNIYVDAFYRSGWGFSKPVVRPEDVSRADIVLVTHAHGDHFDARGVASVASATEATVVGPASVTKALRKSVPEGKLVTMEPGSLPAGGPAHSCQAAVAAAAVTAYRTHHSRDHNSYLIEIGGLRFFHDGDNENTRVLDTAALGSLDALLLGPWQGAGWVELIEALAPPVTLLMHLTDDELDEHEAGTFLPDICDHVPEGIVVLRPGQSIEVG